MTQSGSDSDDEVDTVQAPTVATTAAVGETGTAAADPNYAPRPQPAELDAFCAGGQPSLTGSGMYPGPAPPHVLHTSGATGDLPSEWTATWQANAAKPIELVLCVTLVPGANQIPCDGYNTNTPVFLKDATYNAELKVAATGEVLASDSWVGVSDCPLQIHFQDGENPIVRHRLPEAGLATAFVQPFVAP